LAPNDEIIGPIKHQKKQKGSKFWENFFDEKVLITLFLRLKYKKIVLCHCFMLIQGGDKIRSQNEFGT
jgi:hypothetical protein